MASRNLDLINQQLKTLKDNANSAEQAITYLTIQLKNMLAQSARGGVPTQAGLTGATERLLTGTAGTSPRVGGGAYVPASAIAQMDPIIKDIAAERIKLISNQLKEDALRTRVTQLGSLIDDSYLERNIQLLFENISKYIDDNLEAILRQRYQAVQNLAPSTAPFSMHAQQNYQPPAGGWGRMVSPQAAPLDAVMMKGALKTTLPKIPIPEAEYDKVIKAVQEIENRYTSLGQSIKHVTPRLKEISGDFQRFTETIQTSAKTIESLNFYLDRTGRILTQTEFDELQNINRQTTRAETYETNLQTLGPDQRMGYEVSVQNQIKELEKLGVTAEATGVKVGIIDKEYLKFNTTLKTSIGTEEQHIFYLDKEGVTYDELALKIKKAADAQKKWSTEQLKMGLSPDRAERALAEADRMGFQLQNLKKVYTQQPSGVSFLNFEKIDEATGIMYKGQVALDRFGSVLTQTNRRLLSFTDAIIRNTAEVFKWSLGATLVYQAYFKLGDLIKTAIDNQSKLADVTIALGNANRDLTSIFDDVATVAAQTGESINGVLETYTMAYRAVGSASNEIERTAAANKLLYQATVLNKLSSLDASSAIDVLAGSLRQMAKPQEDTLQAFDRGTELLDKWVALTRRANVDLATLATAFSITAESGLNAGASIEEINAVIASLSEKIGGLGGRETGNAVRALIGGIYQQQAAGALAQYGIAVEDSMGKTRSFLEISRDIFELWESGIIDDTQLNKLGYTLGGGVRRGQQYVAFLKDYVKIQEFANLQADAGGSAQEALGRKLDTVQTSITRVSNSFQRLAQAMGQEGGVLGVANALLSAIGFLVDRFADLNRVLGQLTVPATLLALGALYLKLGGTPARGRIFDWQEALGLRAMQKFSTPIQQTQQQGVGWQGIYGQPPQLPQTTPTAFGKFAGNWLKGGGLLGLMMTMPGAISEFGEGDYGAAVGKAGGAIGGGIIGSLTGAGPIVGSVLGSAIADFFILSAEEKKENFQSIFDPIWKEGATKITETSTAEEKRAAAERIAFTAIGGGEEAPNAEYWGRLGAQAGLLFNNTFWKYFGVPEETQKLLQELGLMTEKDFKNPQFQGMSELQIAIATAYEAGQLTDDAIRQLKETMAYVPKEVTYAQSEYAQRQEEIATQYADFLEKTALEFRENLLAQLSKGEVGQGEFKEQTEASYAIPASASREFSMLTLEGEDFERTLVDMGISFEEFTQLILNATEENRQQLSQYVTEMIDALLLIEAFSEVAPDTMVEFAGDTMEAVKALEILNEKLKIAQSKGVGQVELMSIVQGKTEAEKAQALIPPIVDAEGIATPENIKAIEDSALKLQEAFYDKMVEMEIMTSAQAESALSNTAPILVSMGEGMGYYLMQGLVDSKFFQQALEMSAAKLSFEFMTDITMAQLQAVLPQYEAMKAAIIAMGGVVNEVKQLVFLSGMTTPIPLEYDWKIIQFLLTQLLDTSKEQTRLQEKELELEGIYNLPGGSTFYVPFDAYKMGAGKDKGEEDDLTPAAEALEAAAEDLRYASEALLESLRADRYGLTPEELQELWHSGSAEAQIAKLIDSLFPGEPGFQQDPTAQKLQEVLAEVRSIRARMEEPDTSTQTGWSGFPPRTASEGGWSASTQTGWMGMPPETTEDMSSIGEKIAEAITTALETKGLDSLNTALESLQTTISNLIDTITNWNPFGTSQKESSSNLQNISYSQPTDAVFNDMAVSYSDMTIGNAELTIPLDVSTKLTINLNTSMQLLVDGAVLAEIVKPYLYTGLVQYQNSTTTATRSATFL